MITITPANFVISAESIETTKSKSKMNEALVKYLYIIKF